MSDSPSTVAALDLPENQRILQRLLQTARIHGQLTWDQINEALPPDPGCLDVIEELIHLFQRIGIPLREPGEINRGTQRAHAVPSIEEIPESSAAEDSDPVRQYSEQLRRHPPLSPETETRLITERGDLFLETAFAISRSPQARAWWLETLGAVAVGNSRGDRWFSSLPPRDDRQAFATDLLTRFENLSALSDPELRELIAGTGVRYDWAADFVEKFGAESPEVKALFDKFEKRNDRLIESHLRLAAGLAASYTGRGLAFLDLVQEANLALTKAARRLSPGAEGSFAARASHLIRQAISTALSRQNRRGAFSPTARKEKREWSAAKDELTANSPTHTEPDWKTLADRVGSTPERVRERLRPARDVSLDEPAGLHTRETRADYLADPRTEGDTQGRREQRSLMEQALKSLTERERQILMRRVGWNDTPVQTVAEVAEALGISESRVTQIEARAIRKMRHPALLSLMDQA